LQNILERENIMTTTTTATTGYSDELAEAVRIAYVAAGNKFTVAMAMEFKRSLASLRAHASRRGYYVKAKTKATVATVGKADMAAELVKVMGIDAEYTPQLQKLTAQCLVNMLAAVKFEQTE
jgi:hypothetical protein